MAFGISLACTHCTIGNFESLDKLIFFIEIFFPLKNKFDFFSNMVVVIYGCYKFIMYDNFF
jgi:hypothetical protein